MISLNNDQLIAAAHSRIEFAKMMLSDNPEPLKERTWAIELRLAEFALAALTAEPVAWEVKGILCHTLAEANCYIGEPEPLYAAPPAPVSVPDEKPMPNTLSMYAMDAVAVIAEVRGWNACRAATLQGAEPVHDVDNTNRQFESLGCAEDTTRRFKCTGLIVTSDERKMQMPAAPQQEVK